MSPDLGSKAAIVFQPAGAWRRIQGVASQEQELSIKYVGGQRQLLSLTVQKALGVCEGVERPVLDQLGVQASFSRVLDLSAQPTHVESACAAVRRTTTSPKNRLAFHTARLFEKYAVE